MVVNRFVKPCERWRNTRNKARRIEKRSCQLGLWLSLVERLPRVQEAVGSNPTSPMISEVGDLRACHNCLPQFFE
jgi:hypothetical protein